MLHQDFNYYYIMGFSLSSIGSSLGSFGSNIVSPLSGIIGAAQSGWNFFKDLTNLDTRRSVQASERLMHTSAQEDANLMGLQHGYNMESMSAAQMFNRENMDYAQKLNEFNMAKQYTYNMALSNQARGILQARLAGINPDAASSASGSVSSSTPQGSSPNPLSVGIGSVGAPAVAQSQYSPSAVPAETFLLQKEGELKDSQSNLVNEQAYHEAIDNVTRMATNLVTLQEQYQRIRESVAKTKNLDAQTKETLDTLQVRIEHMQQSIKQMDAQIHRYEVQNQIDQDTLEQQKWYQRAQITIERMRVGLEQQKINLDAQLLTPTIAKLSAEADRLFAEGNTINQVRELTKQKYEAEITELAARAGLEEAEAVKAGAYVFGQAINGIVDGMGDGDYQEVTELDEKGNIKGRKHTVNQKGGKWWKLKKGLKMMKFGK